jgi:8-amino-7-oxononanoate synthase
MGTLGKAFGTAGAFVAGSASLRDWLLNRARTFVFATAPPPGMAAAALEAIRIVEGEPTRRVRLEENARRLERGLEGLGRPVERATGDATTTTSGRPGHITALRIGDPGETVRVGRALEDLGYLVGTIRPPSVPPDTSRLRVSLSSEHTDERIDGLLRALAELLPPASR